MLPPDDARRRRPSRRSQPLVDAADAVRGVHRLVTDLLEHSLTLRCETPGEPLLVDIDRRPLEQVLLNLIFHAQDRCGVASSTIWLDAARVEVRATPGANPNEPPPGGYARLRVTDNGPTLSERDRASLFEPGVSGEVRGLAVAYTIVRDAGGLVAVEQRQRGTSISVFLPIVQTRAPAPGTRQA